MSRFEVISINEMLKLKKLFEDSGKENQIDYFKLKYHINDNGKEYVINPEIENANSVDIKIDGNIIDLHYVKEGSTHHYGKLYENEKDNLESKIYRAFITWKEDYNN